MVAAPQHMTEAEYLTFEETSEIRHEYVNGTVYAMTGASWTHNIICSNIHISLGTQLAGGGCAVVTGDLRVKVESKVAYRYPDLMVVCDGPSFVDGRVDTIDNPTLIVEVLSPALSDRNEKLHEYIQLSTLREYVLVSQHTAQIERFLRQESDEWLYKQVTGLGNTLELPSIQCTLQLAQVYDKLEIGK